MYIGRVTCIKVISMSFVLVSSDVFNILVPFFSGYSFKRPVVVLQKVLVQLIYIMKTNNFLFIFNFD